ncbi:hypothetical protein NDU88_005876 [Pleurodeles waltl]|uniref:Uncharacterized protein n=1 Tax=Pleurodeles waltl TaxID=8319 RepID=A0AAV7QMJ5_PLEWA|nr:hypothetical protein NDU88_005876 [Pleurodeles waltl]
MQGSGAVNSGLAMKKGTGRGHTADERMRVSSTMLLPMLRSSRNSTSTGKENTGPANADGLASSSVLITLVPPKDHHLQLLNIGH